MPNEKIFRVQDRVLIGGGPWLCCNGFYAFLWAAKPYEATLEGWTFLLRA
jgi:hypothetical protein